MAQEDYFCYCPSGYDQPHGSTTEACVPVCATHLTRDSSSNLCVCTDGYEEVSSSTGDSCELPCYTNE